MPYVAYDELHMLHMVTYKLHTDYIQITYRLHIDYIQVHTNYIFNTYKAYNSYTNYIEHIQITYKLHTNYICHI